VTLVQIIEPALIEGIGHHAGHFVLGTEFTALIHPVDEGIGRNEIHYDSLQCMPTFDGVVVVEFAEQFVEPAAEGFGFDFRVVAGYMPLVGEEALVRNAFDGEFGQGGVELFAQPRNGLVHVIDGKVFTANAEEVLGASGNFDFALLEVGEADGISDQVTPGSGAGCDEDGVGRIEANIGQGNDLGIGQQFAVLVEILSVKGNEFVEYAVAEIEAHTTGVDAGLVGEETFAGEIGFKVHNGLAHEAVKPFAVRFEGHATVHIDRQVGPDIVNRVEVVLFDDHLKQHLDPGRNAGDHHDIPFGRFVNDERQLLMPVALFFDFVAGFGKALEPDRDMGGCDATEIARPNGAIEVEVGAAADHQVLFGEVILGEIGLQDGHNLARTGAVDRFDHVAGNRNVLGSGFGSSGAHGEEFHLTGPGYIFFSVVGALPPRVHGRVVAGRNAGCKGCVDITCQQDFFKAMGLAEGSFACVIEEFFELALLKAQCFPAIEAHQVAQFTPLCKQL